MDTKDITTLRYIPKGSVAVDLDGKGVVYTYEIDTIRYAVAYVGNAWRHTWHFSFPSEDSRRHRIDSLRASLNAHAKRKAERKAERSVGHPLVVGDVIYNSWGYDQTNIDFYWVVATTKNYVTLAPLQSVQVQSEGPMSMAAYVVPDAAGPRDKSKEFRARADSRGNVTMRHGSGFKWDGTPKYMSWYA